MYEDNDNLYLVSDMDEDIKKRKELIEEAKISMPIKIGMKSIVRF